MGDKATPVLKIADLAIGPYCSFVRYPRPVCHSSENFMATAKNNLREFL